MDIERVYYLLASVTSRLWLSGDFNVIHQHRFYFNIRVAYIPTGRIPFQCQPFQQVLQKSKTPQIIRSRGSSILSQWRVDYISAPSRTHLKPRQVPLLTSYSSHQPTQIFPHMPVKLLPDIILQLT